MHTIIFSVIQIFITTKVLLKKDFGVRGTTLIVLLHLFIDLGFIETKKHC